MLSRATVARMLIRHGYTRKVILRAISTRNKVSWAVWVSAQSQTPLGYSVYVHETHRMG